MYEFKIGDLVRANKEDLLCAPKGTQMTYGIVITTLDGGSHRKNQSVFVRWQNEAIDTWVVAPKLIKVAEAKNELQ